MYDANRWGQARDVAKVRMRRIRITAAMLIVLALPFLLDVGARFYARSGGTMRQDGFPLWLPFGFWVAELMAAIGGAAVLFRGSDEFQRRALIEGAAVAGSLLMLLLPPFFFMGQIFGSHHVDAVFGLWIAAVVSGALAYRLRLKQWWA